MLFSFTNIPELLLFTLFFVIYICNVKNISRDIICEHQRHISRKTSFNPMCIANNVRISYSNIIENQRKTFHERDGKKYEELEKINGRFLRGSDG